MAKRQKKAQKALFDLAETDAADLLARAKPDEAMRGTMRICEALIFASTEPLSDDEMLKRLPEGADLPAALAYLKADYFTRGVQLVRVAKKWMFRTSPDLAWVLQREKKDVKKLSRAALETLAIVAYHQPATRAEIEDIRGVALSKGTMDVLLETGWVRLRGRRRAPGRPITYGTTESFLAQFGLEQISDLPGLDELKGAGLFDGRLPKGFGVPQPRDDAGLTEDEEPLGDDPLHEAFAADLPGGATEE
jgi:segregation and condensation protein B